MSNRVDEASELIALLPRYLDIVEDLGQRMDTRVSSANSSQCAPDRDSGGGRDRNGRSNDNSSTSNDNNEDSSVVAELTYENRILTEKNTFLHKSIENLVETSQRDALHVQQVNDELKMALSKMGKRKAEVLSLKEKLMLLQKTMKTMIETRDCEIMLNDMNASLRHCVEQSKINEVSAATELVSVLEDSILIKQDRDASSAQLKEVKRKMLSLESQVSINEKLIMRESLQDEIKRLKNQNVLLQGQNKIMRKEIEQSKDILKMSESHEKVVERVLESADKMQESLADLMNVGASSSTAASTTTSTTQKSQKSGTLHQVPTITATTSNTSTLTAKSTDGERVDRSSGPEGSGKTFKKRKMTVSQSADDEKDTAAHSPLRDQPITCPACSSLPCGLMLTCNSCLLPFHVRCCKDQVQERNGDIVLDRCSSCQSKDS